MNKKNLSVVMAGAMLATSVAPVLADTTNNDLTVNGSNKGLLIKELRELLESKTFANEEYNGDYAGKSVYYVKEVSKEETINISKTGETTGSKTDYLKFVNKEIDALKSKTGWDIKNVAFWGSNDTYISLVGKTGQEVVLYSGTDYEVTVNVNKQDVNAKATLKVKSIKKIDTVEDMETAIQNASNGDKFEAWDKGHREESGKFYAYDTKLSTKEDFEKIVADWNSNPNEYKAVLSMELDGNVLTVRVRQAETETTHVVKTYKAGESKLLNFKKAMSSDNKELKADYKDENGLWWITSGFDHFADLDATEAARLGIENVKYDIDESLVKRATVDDADKVYNVKLSDLYDGLFLTDKGQALVDAMKLYDSKELGKDSAKWDITDSNGNGSTKSNDGFSQEFKVNDSANGLYSIEMVFTKPVPGLNNNANKFRSRVVITTNDKKQMDLFAKGIRQHDTRLSAGLNREGASRKFPVQVLAGSNRYETAVKVAKENADITTVAENGNIVLVNGNSLVDGLAAAPLAASVQNLNNNGTASGTNYAAPILLTDTNGIPKATKEYMKEVIAEQRVGQLGEVTVYLVGGESVISKSVENDLKEIGFRVVRAGGADREATSLAVAKLMNEKEVASGINDKNAFVVGAYGEADAMSIAPVAAATGTPIIVESVHGISEDTIDYLKGYKLGRAKDVTIIGGETTVSASTENTLKEEKIETARLAGENRKETNAKVIDAYYGVNGNTNGVAVNPGHQFENVVVSKDGMNNKSELIDALTATSLAVRDNAPIVLGTKSLSKSQINTLEKNASRNGIYVYQVGLGVARDVVKTIADRVELAK